MLALYAATSGGDGSCTADPRLRRTGRDSLAEDEADSFFNSQASGRNAAILQTLRDQCIRTFIFLPNPHICTLTARSVGQLLARTAFFKSRADIARLAFRWKDHREHALATVPAHAGEVFERRSFHQEDGIQRVRSHKLARFLLPLFAFLARNRLCLSFH